MGEPRVQRTLAIDFDGVLHKYSLGWLDGSIYDLPMPGAVEAVTKLVSAGFSYYVLTTRCVDGRDDIDSEQQRADIETWLRFHKFPAPIRITGEKHPALAYIDDRAVRFTSWEDVRKWWS